MNWYKIAQLSNYLQQLGHTPNLISYVNSLPKNVQKGIGNFVNSNQNASEIDIKNFIQSFNPQNQNIKQNPIDIVFQNQNITKEDFFSHISEHYIPFVSKALINKEKRPEDLFTILDVLYDFENIKQYNLPIEKDINKYISFQQLQNTVINFSTDNKEAARVKVDPRSLEGVTLFKQSGPYSIWKVSSEESLKQIGMGTKWCTRGGYEDCQASYYLNQYESIYVVTKGSELIIQFTPDLDQVMDVLDNQIERLPDGLNLNNFVRSTGKLQYASEKLRDTPSVVFEAMEIDGENFRYASEELKNDKEFALDAIGRYGLAFRYISEELKNDEDFLISMTKVNEACVKFLSQPPMEKIFRNEDFALKAVKESSIIYTILHPFVRKNFQITMEAVKKDGMLLQYAPDELKNNEKVVLEAVKNDGSAISFCSEQLLNSPKVMLESVRQDGLCLRFAPKELKNNPQIVLEAIKQNAYALRFSSTELQDNEEIVLKALEGSEGEVLSYASERLKNDENFLSKAVLVNTGVYRILNRKSRANQSILLKAIEKDPSTLFLADYDLKNNEEFMLKAIKANPKCSGFASSELRNNPEFMNKVNNILQQKRAKNMTWYKVASQSDLLKESDINWNNVSRNLGIGTGLGASIPIALSLMGNPDNKEKPTQQTTQVEQNNQTQENPLKTQPKANSSVTDDELEKFIAPFEGGYVSKAYKDSKGIWTVGVGFNLERKDADSILKSVGATKAGLISQKEQLNKQQMSKIFRLNLKTAKADALKWIPNLNSQPKEVQLIIVDMSFNLGGPKLQEFVKTRKAIIDKNYKLAASEMQNSAWFGQVGQRSKHHVDVMNRLGSSKKK